MNWCPRDWTPASGQLLDISSHTALFSLYGTLYGGNGRTNFGLPDLRGRAPISQGKGPGLNNYTVGQPAGSESLSFALNVNQMPSHTHSVTKTATLHASSGPGSSPEPSDNILANDGNDSIYSNVAADVTMSNQAITTATTVGNTGANQPVSAAHRGPVLTMTWCVSLGGTYPSRN